MKEFENDTKLGIASSGTKHIIGNKIIHAKVSIDEPSGGHMLIRRNCFGDCGGIPLSYAMDSVLKAKARLRGWKTRRFEKNIATEIRDVSSAEGYWKGFVNKGKASHYLNLHPVHVVVRSFIYSYRRRYYAGVAYLSGYLSSIIKRERKEEDEEVKNYFRNKWKKYLGRI
jgi:hypothetical protein